MDSTLIAALIGAFATLGAAGFSGAYGSKHGIQLKQQSQRRRFFVIATVMSLFVAGSIYGVLRDMTEQRISSALPSITGQEKIVYPRVGMGFSIPSYWQVDDASFRFASGDIDLIRNLDPTSASISQGLKLRFLNIQESYINDPKSEIDNQLDVWKSIDPNTSVSPVTFAGIPANRFFYQQSTGARTGFVEQTWIRLSDRVKLQITSFSNLDVESRLLFEQERDNILNSFVIDEEKLQELTD